jgi:uncharacterized MAPEG superfamily protein
VAGQFAIIAVPLSYVASLIPKGRAMAVYSAATNGRNSNKNPRRALQDGEHVKDVTVKDKLARLYSAHLNGLEASFLFSSCVALGFATGVDGVTLDSAASTFIIARLVYNGVYEWADTSRKALLRSVVWVVGLSATFSIPYAAYKKFA